VRNVGERSGDEVVQLYVHDLAASVVRPVQELKGFVRVGLEPGRACRVTFVLPADLLSFTAVDQRRVVEPGEVEIQVAASSADVRLQGFLTLVGDVRTVGEDRALRSEVSVASLEG
jgi:hypothetical protein